MPTPWAVIELIAWATEHWPWDRCIAATSFSWIDPLAWSYRWNACPLNMCRNSVLFLAYNRVWNIVTWVLVKLLRLVLSCSRYPGTISRTQRDLQRVGTFCFRDARIPNPVVVLLYCHWPSGRWFWNWFWMVLEGGPLFDDAHQCSLYNILYRYMFSLSLIIFYCLTYSTLLHSFIVLYQIFMNTIFYYIIVL